MSTGEPPRAFLSASGLTIGAIVISFLATMVAFWSFDHSRVGWGAYNSVIALVCLSTFIAVRARSDNP